MLILGLTNDYVVASVLTQSTSHTCALFTLTAFIIIVEYLSPYIQEDRTSADSKTLF